jgi:anti-sigma factor RsiW
MKHTPDLEKMQSALDGLLPPEQKAALSEHLVLCPECQSAWVALGRVERLLAAPPLASPRPGFTNRFAARLEQRNSRARAVWGAMALGMGASTAVLAVLVTGGTLAASGASYFQGPAAVSALQAGVATVSTFLAVVLNALFNTAAGFAWPILTSPFTWFLVRVLLALVALWFYLIFRRPLQEVAVL